MPDMGNLSDHERGSIDGRVSFGGSALALGAGLVILLDRVGVPTRFVLVLGPAFALLGLAVIGLLLRSMRVSWFFAGGRIVPASYAGLAIATIAVGLFVPLATPLPEDPRLRSLLVSFFAGSAAAVVLVGPTLRRTGAFSLADLLAARFPNAVFRLGVVAVVAAVGVLVAVAGLEISARTLEQSLGIGRDSALFVAAAVLACATVFGGLASVIWTATAAGAMALFGFGLPVLIVLVTGGGPAPLPLIGDRELWSRALAQITSWNGGVGLAPHLSGAALVTLALGLAVFPPFLVGALTCKDQRAARRAGGAALIWLMIGCALILCTMAMVALNIDTALIGKAPDGLPVWVYAASARGDLTVCRQMAASAVAAKAACGHAKDFAGVVHAADIVTSGRFLMTGLSSVRGLGPAFAGLAAAAVAVPSIVLSAAGLQAFATAIGHDVVYRLRDTGALTSRRLAISRTILILALAAAVMVLRATPVDSSAMLVLATTVSAAILAPISLLALIGRIRSLDAALGLFCGVICAVVMVGSSGSWPDLDTLSVIALPVFLIVACTGLILSFIGARASDSEAAIARAIWRGGREILSPDRGA
jgi:cation/acetate symporter